MEEQIDLILEPLKKYIVDKEIELSEVSECFHDIKEKIMDFEKMLSKMIDSGLEDSYRLYKKEKSKILKKDKSIKDGKTNKIEDKKQLSTNNRKIRINWRPHIIDLLRKYERLTTKEFLTKFEDMGLIPKEDGPARITFIANARSAIGECSKIKIIKKSKGSKSWELGPKAPN